MVAPRYTVIVPMRRFRSDEPALVSLRETAGRRDAIEIFVVEGTHPARQRNAALERAQGEIVVFLDNDCRLAPDFWDELDRAFAQPEVEVVGGPALLRPEASAREKIFHALLTHPLVVGPVSARYAQKGSFRKATQTELILCNLAARRSLFERIGPLSQQLYPNEESEWLERAEMAETGIFYNPKLFILRPQRPTWREFLLMLFRYGSGRTRQFWVSGWHMTSYQLTPLILLIPVAAVCLGPAYLLVFVGLWLLAALGIGLTCAGGLRPWQRVVAGLAAPLIPFTYAAGQLGGWIGLLASRPESDLQIAVCNERGERIR
jgi:succinoglycan biosynthesis protein ExoA